MTDDAQALRERLETVTGERISALEGIGESVQPERERELGSDREAMADARPLGSEAAAQPSPHREVEPGASPRKAPGPVPPERTKVREFDLGL